MKFKEPISAFAVYKNAAISNKASKITKKKGKIEKNKLGKKRENDVKLDSKKVLLGLDNLNGDLVRNLKFESVKLEPVVEKELELTEKVDTKVRKIKRRIKKKDSEDDANDPINEGLKLFEWMISPISANFFFEKHWENDPIHIKRTNKNYFRHILTSKNLDQIFRDNNLHYTRNVDVVIYEDDEKQILNPEGKANPAALWDFYNNGCSIRLLNPQSYNKKVHLLISTLQEYFGSMVGVNAYLTPPNSQGFAPHYDDIEAFVIQLEGKKYWKLYHPKKNEVLARFSSNNFKRDEIGKPFKEITLEAGSVLYFPRGVIHEGKTDENSHSLHLTISVYQNNAYVDILEKILPKALEDASKCDIEFRRGLPLHFLRKENSKKIVKEKMYKLFEKLKSYLDVNVGLEELGRKLVYDSMPPVLSKEELACSSRQDGDTLDDGIVYNKVEFDSNIKIRLTRFHCIQLTNDGNKCKLYYSTENSKTYHGEDEQWLELELNLTPSVEMLKKSYPKFIKIESLPIDDVELKIQFVYDLWEKGIIITEEPLTEYFLKK